MKKRPIIPELPIHKSNTEFDTIVSIDINKFSKIREAAGNFRQKSSRDRSGSTSKQDYQKALSGLFGNSARGPQSTTCSPADIKEQSIYLLVNRLQTQVRNYFKIIQDHSNLQMSLQSDEKFPNRASLTQLPK